MMDVCDSASSAQLEFQMNMEHLGQYISAPTSIYQLHAMNKLIVQLFREERDGLRLLGLSLVAGPFIERQQAYIAAARGSDHEPARLACAAARPHRPLQASSPDGVRPPRSSHAPAVTGMDVVKRTA